jgi:hypothetical protein
MYFKISDILTMKEYFRIYFICTAKFRCMVGGSDLGILGNFGGIFWEFFGIFLGIQSEFFGKSLRILGNFIKILWEFFGNSLEILWEFFGNSIFGDVWLGGSECVVLILGNLYEF